MNSKKWICHHARTRFVPPTQEEKDALKLLTRRTSASHDQVKALRALGANIPAVMMAGKNEVEV
jgi:hypothetical protein